MPYILSLPAPWPKQRWKVKIFDREGAEEPHFSIIQGSTVWRVSLRSFTFLDKKPPPGDVPGDLLDEIRSHLDDLRAAWNRMYPGNPV
jgi:hypothetical protein